MEFLPPFVVHGTHRMTPEEFAQNAHEYRRLVEALRDGRLDLESARRATRLNADLDSILINDTRG
jgi:glutathione-regulated potassium-efflux system ancillary protein KefG